MTCLLVPPRLQGPRKLMIQMHSMEMANLEVCSETVAFDLFPALISNR